MKISIFNLAAWYSLIVSLATFAVVAGIDAASGHTNLLPPMSREFTGSLYGSAFWFEVSSLFFGILSLFGIGMHGAAFILWKAVPGLLASGFFGFGFFMVKTLSGITC